MRRLIEIGWSGQNTPEIYSHNQFAQAQYIDNSHVTRLGRITVVKTRPAVTMLGKWPAPAGLLVGVITPKPS